MQHKDKLSAQEYNKIGKKHYEQKNYAAAILSYNHALALDPRCAFVYINRGAAFYQQGKFQEAISDFNQALTLKPKDAMAYNNRGLANHELKKFNQAISDFSQALAIDPTLLTIYYNRACTYSAKGMIAQALSDFIHVLINPEKFEHLYKRLTVILKKLKENVSILHAVMNELNSTEQMELLALCLNKKNPIGTIYYNDEHFLKNMASHLLELHNKYFIEELKKITNNYKTNTDDEITTDRENKIILLKTCLDQHSFLGKKFIKEYNKNFTIVMEMIELLRHLDAKRYATFTYVTLSGAITNIGFFDKPKPKPIQGKTTFVDEAEDKMEFSRL